MQTTNEHVTALVYIELQRDDQVAVAITAREGRGEPVLIDVSETAITWKSADGALERLGTPADPVSKEVLAAIASQEGLLVMLGDTDTNALVGDFVLTRTTLASTAA
ncbi:MULTISPECIES: hypothetical protein [unclassified Cupriavidus]|uniref:hypothetical protein n=1 Tax=unclassified Cupriavidus TaxID=2640874 RepID=UPI00313BA8AA